VPPCGIRQAMTDQPLPQPKCPHCGHPLTDAEIAELSGERLRKLGSKGGKASAETGDMAERGRKGMAKRWAGHVAKRPSKKT
jgi:hypothetical protein